jgi:hypothetical protein
MSNTKLLDLDAVVSPVDFGFKFKGIVHKLVEPSVEDFLNTMKEVEAVSLSASPAEEIEITIKMIKRSFPSIEDADLRSLKLSQLRELSEWARTAGGQTAEVTEGEGKTENPPAAD